MCGTGPVMWRIVLYDCFIDAFVSSIGYQKGSQETRSTFIPPKSCVVQFDVRSTKSKIINVQNVRLFYVGLFIVDGYYDVYVWEGWMPEDDDDVRTGSGRQRWDKDRRLAMETALNYAKGLFLNNLCIICFAKMFFNWRRLPCTWKNPSVDSLGKW